MKVVKKVDVVKVLGMVKLSEEEVKEARSFSV